MKLWMKLSILGAVALGSNAAFAAELTCRVVTVNESANVWEEGLGVYGSIDADDDSETVFIKTIRRQPTSISIGQMRFHSGNTKLLTHKSDEATTSYFIQVSDENIQVKIYTASERGVILRKEIGDARFKQVATIDCSSIEQLETVVAGSSNLVRMTASEVKSLPKAVKAAMSQTDIAFEIGDGYYDLYELHTYKLLDQRSGDVAGYFEHGFLHYTEGEDVEAFVKYDRNGLRHGPIEHQTLSERP